MQINFAILIPHSGQREWCKVFRIFCFSFLTFTSDTSCLTDFTPQAFGIPLADVIANDVRRRRGPDILEEEGHRTLGNQQGDALGSVGDVCGLRGVTGLRSEPAGGETPPHSQRRV